MLVTIIVCLSATFTITTYSSVIYNLLINDYDEDEEYNNEYEMEELASYTESDNSMFDFGEENEVSYFKLKYD